MSEDVFSRALKAFERMPSPGTLEYAVGILARGGIEQPRIRGWALATAEQYGILSYVRPVFARMMAGAKLAQPER